MTETVRALVLRAFDFSETSLVVTLYSDRLGLLRAIAKGARRPGSMLHGGLGRFSLSSVTLYPRKTGLHVLSEADLEDGFPGLGDSLPAYFGAHYAAEILLGMTAEGDPSAGIFDAALSAFKALSRGLDRDLALFRFEAGMLFHTGHLPLTGECVECGRALDRKAEVAFSAWSGGAFCPACDKPSPEKRVRAKTGTLALLGKFAGAGDMDVSRVRIPAVTRAEMRAVLSACFRSLMERDLRTARFLHFSAPSPRKNDS